MLHVRDHMREFTSRPQLLLGHLWTTGAEVIRVAVSDIGMRHTTLALLFSLLVECLRTPAQDAKKKEPAIQRAKTVLASSLDSTLPKVSLEFFLNYESGGAAIEWEVTDCDEPTGRPTKDREGDKPMCVEADFQKDQTAVTVMVSVGTLQKGLSGAPSLFSMTMNDPAGRVHSLRRLGDLPKELHRPTRGMPRDLTMPTTASSA